MELKPGYKRTEVGVIPEEWVVQRLGDLGTFKNGINKSAEDFGHGFPFVNLMDVFGVPKISKTTGALGLVNSTEAEQKVYSLAPGDVLFVRSSVKPEGVGLTTLVPAEMPRTVFSGFLIRFRDSGSLAMEFKEHCFHDKSFRRRLIAGSTVSANTNINQDSLSDLLLAYPPDQAEQRAIATALSDVDALLTQLDRLITKKRDIKQAAMQQLLTGKTRLPGFGGAWSTRRLGDVGTCLRGVSYQGAADLFEHDTDHSLRLLRANNVQSARIVTDDLQFVRADRASDQQRLRKNDVLICMANGSKALVGKAALFAVADGHSYTFGAFMACFRVSHKESNPVFVFNLFQTGRYRDYISNLLAGSSINNLTPSSIESLEFLMPNLGEQTAIATVLSDLDAELAALEARRDKTRALKQGMMQELLTGRTRLV